MCGFAFRHRVGDRFSHRPFRSRGWIRHHSGTGHVQRDVYSPRNRYLLDGDRACKRFRRSLLYFGRTLPAVHPNRPLRQRWDHRAFPRPKHGQQTARACLAESVLGGNTRGRCVHAGPKSGPVITTGQHKLPSPILHGKRHGLHFLFRAARFHTRPDQGFALAIPAINRSAYGVSAPGVNRSKGPALNPSRSCRLGRAGLLLRMRQFPSRCTHTMSISLPGARGNTAGTSA